MFTLLADDSIEVTVRSWPEAIVLAALALCVAWIIVTAIKSDRWRD